MIGSPPLPHSKMTRKTNFTAKVPLKKQYHLDFSSINKCKRVR